MELRGLGLSDDAVYGEVELAGETPLEEMPPGDRWLKVVPFCGEGMESVDRYELVREVAVVDVATSEDPWGIVASRGVGDERTAPSRRRMVSAKPTWSWAPYSSGGLGALRFWPAAECDSSMYRRFKELVSSISISSRVWWS